MTGLSVFMAGHIKAESVSRSFCFVLFCSNFVMLCTKWLSQRLYCVIQCIAEWLLILHVQQAVADCAYKHIDVFNNNNNISWAQFHLFMLKMPTDQWSLPAVLNTDSLCMQPGLETDCRLSQFRLLAQPSLMAQLSSLTVDFVFTLCWLCELCPVRLMTVFF